MNLRVYHGGKPEGRHQPIEATNEADVGISNELALVQWQHKMTQELTACIQCDGGHSEILL